MKLRAEFDYFKNETDRNKIAALVEEGEERFRRQAHPDPYISMFFNVVLMVLTYEYSTFLTAPYHGVCALLWNLKLSFGKM